MSDEAAAEDTRTIQPEPDEEQASKKTTKKRKRGRGHGWSRKKKKSSKSKYESGRYRKSNADENDDTPIDLRALSKAEDLKLQSRAKSSNLIYKVRGWRVTRNQWAYEGKSRDGKAVSLHVTWLNANAMNAAWRKKTFQSNPRFWFRVATAANTKQTPNQMVPPMNKDSTSPPKKSAPPACTADCLIKFFNHVGPMNK